MGNVVERLLLVFSELATNGLRHAAPPVEVSIARVDGGWLVVAADRAPGAVPNRHAPDPRRSGQHGLIVVDAVSDATGYYTDDRCKHVWATVPDEPTPRLRERLAGLG